MEAVAIEVVDRRHDRTAGVVACVLSGIGDQVASLQSVVSALCDFVLVRRAFGKAAADGIVPSVHVLGVAVLWVICLVTPGFMQIA